MITALVACFATAPDVRAVAVDGGVQITSDQGLSKVELFDGERLIASGHPPGAPLVAWFPAVAGTAARVTFADGVVRTIDVEASTVEAGVAADGVVTVHGVAFPALSDGTVDLARDADRVALTASWGSRSQDAGPSLFAWRAVTLRAEGGAGEVVVSQRVLDGAAPAAGFAAPIALGARRPGAVMVRVPPGGEATVTLPVYVDRAAVVPGTYVFETDVTPLHGGGSVVDRRPVYVTRGSRVAGIGLVAALIGGVAGGVFLAFGTTPFLRRSRTSDLTTIALFATVQFVWGVGSQLFASAATTVLGPFAPMLTGLVDEVVRTALMATLVVLIPRVGTVGASIAVGYVLRLLALGAVTPIDLVWLGDAVFAHEAALWAVGITRGKGAEGSTAARALRLSAALAPAALFTASAALAVHVAAFRLFYADWYVAMVLLGPSFLYVFLACALAVPFADALRRVRP